MSHLVARVEEVGADGFIIRSPAVGIVDSVPELGVYVNPHQVVARLNVMGRSLGLKLPRDVQGRVVEQLIAGTWVPIDYGRPLFKLSKAAKSDAGKESARAQRVGGAEAGLVEVRTPSQGVFYRRPGPDSPPYVEEGSMVGPGTVLGVVEVMKCFNQIAYGGDDVPVRGTVARILVADASEVSFNQVIMLVKPA
jgi:biotin carboxyl carrier protein